MRKNENKKGLFILTNVINISRLWTTFKRF